MSALQRGDELKTSQVQRAVAVALNAYGHAGCAERMAQEFGDHPETAAVRMRWAPAADPVLLLLVRNVPGHLYDLMVTVGPAADGIIASSRRRLLASIRVRDADGARREMEQHVEGLRSAAIQAMAMVGTIHTPNGDQAAAVEQVLEPLPFDDPLSDVGAFDPAGDKRGDPAPSCPVMPSARRGRCRAALAEAGGGS